MGKILEYRERVCDAIRTLIPKMDVEWYDGIFDEKDVGEWILRTPAARVAVMKSPTKHHSTGELNTYLRVVCVVVETDGRGQRDGDMRVWDWIEQIAVFANLNKFGDLNAGPATEVNLTRLSDTDLRRDGVTIGVVEWETCLTIGNNRAYDRDQVFFENRHVTQTPGTVTARGNIHMAGNTLHDELDVSPED
jgi:hypothetical protein